jgi:hypothetical protein
MELKSVQQIIRILHDEKANSYNLKNQVNLPNLTYKRSEDKLRSEWKPIKVSHSSEKTDIVKHKIRILGDSHARGLAKELKYSLTQEFETQGVVKLGSSLEKLVNTSRPDLKALTMGDVRIVWGSSKDVGQNESTMGIRALKQFLSFHKHTNVIVLSVPHRHDLSSNSCVNHEVQVFNRLLN